VGEVRRRWVSETQVLEELEWANTKSMEMVQEYAVQAREAAETEAAHKALRAKRVLLARANGARSAELAMAEAEGDPAVAEAFQARLIAAAMADATREALRSIRNNQDSLRTAIASLRDQVAGPGYSGR
jgi:hypothetical protein